VHGYEWPDYVPGYTKDQKEFLLKQLSIMMEENSQDVALIEILQEYHTDIRTNKRTDRPAAADNKPES
jgi:hypothetical protein